MSSLVSCPQCSQPVESHARFCKHCGVDLALAAVLAEQWFAPPGLVDAGVPISPEILVPRIGDTLLERGLITGEELQRALDYQASRSREGHPLLLGHALLELNLVTQETLDQVITVQILQLQNALKDANQQLEHRVQERTLDLQKALDRLAELNQLKSNFIANISHELRTPLTHIKGYLDILVDGGLGPLSAQQSEAVGVMRRAESRLERLIEDLIQFSLASRGELSLQFATVDLVALVQNAVNRTQYKARMAEVSLVTKLAEDAMTVMVDEDKLGWVLLQLLDNAVKFTSAGGQVNIVASVDQNFATLKVIDTGIGIPEDQIQDIFEPFHQLDGSPTRRFGGTGLGLAMVRRIIEAHGSQIRVESMMGKGSSFEFSLPLVAQQREDSQKVVNVNL